MKRSILAALVGLVVFCGSSQAFAQQAESGFGLGLILGDPTGLSLKGWTTGNMAIDGAIGFDIIDDDDQDFRGHFTVLWHFPLASMQRANMLLYTGPGAAIAIWDRYRGRDRRDDDEFWLGARGSVGLDFTFLNPPLDVFIELALVLWLIDDVDVDWDGAAGLRYWF